MRILEVEIKNGDLLSKSQNENVFDNEKHFAGLTDINVLKDTLKNLKKQNEQFVIEINGKVRAFDYVYNDAIFTLSSPNDNFDSQSSMLETRCNCCYDEFKRDKDKRLHC